MMKITPCKNRAILNPCTLENYSYQIDPYIGCEHYCYYCYVLPQAETDWRKEILVHADMAGRLATALSDIPPQTIYLGWHTDPYQPCEAHCRQTRQVLELLADSGFSASILTKSDRVLRDMDILQAMPDAGVSISVAFNTEKTRRLFEANTTATADRIAALKELKSAGIRTAALICPVMPYITQVASLIDSLAEHAGRIWIYGLSMLDKSNRNWQHLADIFKRHFPDLKKEIETVIFSREHAYWHALRQELQQMQNDRALDLQVHL